MFENRAVGRRVRADPLAGGAWWKVPEAKVDQDGSDDVGILNEIDHFHRLSATGAHRRIRFVDLLDQPCPILPICAVGRRQSAGFRELFVFRHLPHLQVQLPWKIG